MEDLNTIRLSEIASVQTGPFGSQLHKEDYVDVGTPIITVEHLGGFKIGRENLPKVSEADKDRLRKYTLREGDTVFSRVGSVDRCSYVTNEEDGWLFSGRCLRLRVQDDETDPRFLYYALTTPEAKEFIRAIAVGATMPSINTQIMGEVEIPDFPLPIQIGIADVLGSLDDKIATNSTAIKYVDGLLRLLWEMLIEGSSKSAALSSLARFVNGRAFTKGASGTGRVVARIAEMNSGIGSSTVFNDIEVAEDNTVYPGDLLFSWSGSLMTKRWPYDEAIVNQHIFKVVPDQGLSLWALKNVIDKQLEYFRMIADGKATTMGHIKRGDLDEVVVIPEEIDPAIDALGNNLWSLASKLEKENTTLARIRDELLPLLMSGRITVAGASESGVGAGVEGLWEGMS